MVLESLLTPEEVERKPLAMFLLGLVLTSIAVWFSYGVSFWLPEYGFTRNVSAWILFLTTLALVQIVHRLLSIEEGKDTKLSKETFLQRHDEVILAYLFMFFGMVVAFSFWFTILPDSMISVMFKDQIAELARIQNLRFVLTGGAVGAAGVTGYAIKNTILKVILFNNLRLLFLFVAFSFMFGAGAILLLTWNAGVVGVAIGTMARAIPEASSMLARGISYAQVLPASFLGFFVHGIFEVLGYFVGAIAGGILSVSVVRRHYQTPYFGRVMKDISLLLALATVLIIVGAYIEVYITPIL